MGATVHGLVLCRAGSEPLAFEAGQVHQIGTWEPGTDGPAHARALFSLAPAAGKRLHGDGESLVVDSLEVVSEPLPLLQVPGPLAQVTGGALRGFVLAASGALWPLYALAPLARHLRLSGGAA